MKRPIITLPVVLLFALTACSVPAPTQDGPTSQVAGGPSAVSPKATPVQTVMPAGRYQLTTKAGANISFTLPTPATDAAVTRIEAYRVKVGAAPVSYVVADVDNRKGTELVNMYMISAFNEEGRQFTFSSVAEVIDFWKPTYSSDYKWIMPDGKVLEEAEGEALSSEGNDLYNENINDADVAERTTIVLASFDAILPNEFTRVAVLPSGIIAEEEEARPAP